MSQANEHSVRGVGPTDLSTELVRLEHTAGTPLPTGSLLLWSAEVHGALLRVERACPPYFEQLERIRADIALNDPLRLARVQRLEAEAKHMATDLAYLHLTTERLAHTNHPDSPTEFFAASTLRQDILAWVMELRALEREHDEWQSESLQVDIGGPG
jgi:hypothetical protein